MVLLHHDDAPRAVHGGGHLLGPCRRQQAHGDQPQSDALSLCARDRLAHRAGGRAEGDNDTVARALQI
ncbi:MAG: hypothetical protein Q8N07_09360, partial [Rhodocyclaceae bacterium]|nr:hypothetical protein [Rhodocyclaceae bacterium]